jgi:transcriptional regulator with XRE-family HTH domain
MAAIAFGTLLRNWRASRRMSQLDLSLTADVSARHIAFLETGRSRPSRAMVMRLCETLDVPRAERNHMLDAAGFRAAWIARHLDEPDMAPIRAAIARMIERHAPYPALALDRHWVVTQSNAPAIAMLAAFGLAPDACLLDILWAETDAARIENWAEVAAHAMSRLRVESAAMGGDAVLDDAAARIAGDPRLAAFEPLFAMPPVSPAIYRIGGQRFSIFSTIAHFGTAEDIALADLRIELFFPADAATEAAFAALGEQAGNDGAQG